MKKDESSGFNVYWLILCLLFLIAAIAAVKFNRRLKLSLFQSLTDGKTEAENDCLPKLGNSNVSAEATFFKLGQNVKKEAISRINRINKKEKPENKERLLKKTFSKESMVLQNNNQFLTVNSEINKSHGASEDKLLVPPNSHEIDKVKAIEVQKLTIDLASCNNPSDNPFWVDLGGLYIHAGLFEKGILVVVSLNQFVTGAFDKVTSTSFLLNSKEFKFANLSDSLSDERQKLVNKQLELVAKLNHLSNGSDVKFKTKNPMIVNNPTKRDENYVPFVTEYGTNVIGSYVNFWFSKNSNKATTEFLQSFDGFEIFSTAQCILGSAVFGVNQTGAHRQLIKHNPFLLDKEKIVGIMYLNKEAKGYEKTSFENFRLMVESIKCLAKKGTDPVLYCHLPGMDYILFCVQLFLNDRMTLNALETFCKLVLEKQNFYKEQLEKICEIYNTKLIVCSPFDNLVDVKTFVSAEMLLNYVFGINGNTSIDWNKDQIDFANFNEVEFVKKCLLLLQTNSINEVHGILWNKFLIGKQAKVITIEDLLGTGNSLVVGAVTYGKKDLTTCSFLPVSEKPIQIGYEKYCKQDEDAPVVCFITHLDRVVAYSAITNPHGGLFYFADDQNKLSKLVDRYGLLSMASDNLVMNKVVMTIKDVKADHESRKASILKDNPKKEVRFLDMPNIQTGYVAQQFFKKNTGNNIAILRSQSHGDIAGNNEKRPII